MNAVEDNPPEGERPIGDDQPDDLGAGVSLDDISADVLGQLVADAPDAAEFDNSSAPVAVLTDLVEEDISDDDQAGGATNDPLGSDLGVPDAGLDDNDVPEDIATDGPLDDFELDDPQPYADVHADPAAGLHEDVQSAESATDLTQTVIHETDGTDNPMAAEPDELDFESELDALWAQADPDDLESVDAEPFDDASDETTGEFAAITIDAEASAAGYEDLGAAETSSLTDGEDFDDILRDATNAALEDHEDPFRPARERTPTVVPDAAIDTWMRSTGDSDDWIHRASRSTKTNIVFALLFIAAIAAVAVVMAMVLSN